MRRPALLLALLLAAAAPAVELKYACTYRLGVSFGVVGWAHVSIEQLDDRVQVSLRVESDQNAFIARRARILYERTAVLEPNDFTMLTSTVAYDEKVDLPWVHKDKRYRCDARRTEDGVAYSENGEGEKRRSAAAGEKIYDPLSPIAAGFLAPEGLAARQNWVGLMFDRGRLRSQTLELNGEGCSGRRCEQRIVGEGDGFSFALARPAGDGEPFLPVEIKIHLKPGFLVAKLQGSPDQAGSE